MTATIIPFPGKFRPTATATASISSAPAAVATVSSLLDLPCTCLSLGAGCPACAGWKRHFLTVRQRVALRGKGTRKPAPTIPCPYDSIVSAYHAALPNLPQVKLRDGPTWSDRQKAMRSMWGWLLSSRKADGSARAETTEQALNWFGNYFARAAANDFLMGRTARGAGHENWQCDIDFLLSKKGMKQVIEKTEAAA